MRRGRGESGELREGIEWNAQTLGPAKWHVAFRHFVSFSGFVASSTHDKEVESGLEG